MEDSLTTALTGGSETLNYLMPFIVGGLIVPIVGALKKYVSFVEEK